MSCGVECSVLVLEEGEVLLMWIKMDEILERGLSFILLHCFVLYI